MGKHKAPRAPHVQREKAHQMYLAGHTGRDIGSALAVHEMTVSQWVRRFGWKAQRDKMIQQTSDVIVSKAEALKHDLIVKHQNKIHDVVSAKIDSLSSMPAFESKDLDAQASALRKFDDVARRNLGLDINDSGQRGTGNLNLFLGSHELQPTPISQPIEAETIEVEKENRL